MTKKIKVSRADVHAARARVALDKQSNEKTPAWITKLAAVSLAAPAAGRKADVYATKAAAVAAARSKVTGTPSTGGSVTTRRTADGKYKSRAATKVRGGTAVPAETRRKVS